MSTPRIAFTFIVEPYGHEVTWVAATEKEAHRMAWAALADDVKDGCECLDCVNEVALEPQP